MTTPAQSELFRLLYRSRSTLAGSDARVEAQFDQVLETSRRNNDRDGVTGALMFTASMFVQALEGPRGVLEQTFERICCDLRHSEVEILEFASAPERAFGAWSLHRVSADTAVEALFVQFGRPEGSLLHAADAAASAVTLMAALANAHGPPTAAKAA